MTFTYVRFCFLFCAILMTQARAKGGKNKKGGQKHKTGTDFSQLQSAVNEFNEEVLYEKLFKGKDENLVFSPLSIHETMTMAYVGATRTTRDEMTPVLGYSSDYDAANGYEKLMDSLNNAGNVEVNITNAVFNHPLKPVKDFYLKAVTSTFKGEVKQLHNNNPENKINAFISKKTNGIIENILPKKSLSKKSLNKAPEIVIVNAIYFNGTWENPFNKQSTKRADFKKSKGGSSKVRMMSTVVRLPYKEDDDLSASVVQLPFEGGRFGLYIVLPNSNKGINRLEEKFSETGTMAALFEGYQKQMIDVKVPKFSIQTTLDDLENTFKGKMPLAFDKDQAEFAWISDDDVSITKVAHKAVIDVNEAGTVASDAKPAAVGKSAKHSFVADHPFVFFLYDKETSQVLLQGKFVG